jgi:hypothetical protein
MARILQESNKKMDVSYGEKMSVQKGLSWKAKALQEEWKFGLIGLDEKIQDLRAESGWEAEERSDMEELHDKNAEQAEEIAELKVFLRVYQTPILLLTIFREISARNRKRSLASNTLFVFLNHLVCDLFFFFGSLYWKLTNLMSLEHICFAAVKKGVIKYSEDENGQPDYQAMLDDITELPEFEEGLKEELARNRPYGQDVEECEE